MSQPNEISVGPTVREIADRMIAEISTDLLDGTVPCTVASFSELHDYVDANMYADELQAQCSDDWLDYVNDATDIVDAWLKARH